MSTIAPEAPQALDSLADTHLLRDVEPALVQRLQAACRPLTLEGGRILLSPLTDNRNLYFLMSGRLHLYLSSLDGTPHLLVEPGECIGEVSLLDGQRPTAYVICEGDCQLLELPGQVVDEALRDSPTLMHNLLRTLCTRVRHGNRIVVDSERNANIDSLTGLYNRRWLEQVFARESTRCRFDGTSLGLLVLDVDHFKAYNDRHGHLAGDHALCLVAHTLRQLLRPSDSMFRYGGEEFVIVLPELTRDEARSIADRLRECLAQIPSFYSPEGLLPGVTLSIGLAMLEAGDSLERLIGRADEALYRAKQEGRNRVCG